MGWGLWGAGLTFFWIVSFDSDIKCVFLQVMMSMYPTMNSIIIPAVRFRSMIKKDQYKSLGMSSKLNDPVIPAMQAHIPSKWHVQTTYWGV